ncbi:hypothetical protein DFH09DRAFT_1435788 [Mycena vulgaris]|nr:hypothetical protein DFH09DRAFT_1435788 [Mycena vulgaris]
MARDGTRWHAMARDGPSKERRSCTAFEVAALYELLPPEESPRAPLPICMENPCCAEIHPGSRTVCVCGGPNLVAGIAQAIISYELCSFEKLDETKPINTLQAAASLACDLFITAYLCIFLTSQNNRGTLTALSSGLTMVLLLVLPDTFWFFLDLRPVFRVKEREEIQIEVNTLQLSGNFSMVLNCAAAG